MSATITRSNASATTVRKLSRTAMRETKGGGTSATASKPTGTSPIFLQYKIQTVFVSSYQ